MIQSFIMETVSYVHTVIATVAFAVGLDSPNIHNVIHWGSPGDLEMYMYLQHTGRGDVMVSTLLLYFTGVPVT